MNQLPPEAQKRCEEMAEAHGTLMEEIEQVLDDVVFINDEPCRHDHHGYCQAHNLEDDCHIKRAREILSKLRARNK